MAEDFLRGTMHRDPAALDFVEVSEVARPHRTDRVFTWKERDFNLHDATYRDGSLAGGRRGGGYREYLKIPEQWTRDYERLRSKNDASATVDAAFMVALMVGLVVVIVDAGAAAGRALAARGGGGRESAWRCRFSRSSTHFRLQEFDYPTTDSYGSFLSRQVLQRADGRRWAAGGLLFVLTAGAETLYREAFAGKISLGNLFRAARAAHQALLPGRDAGRRR